MSLDFIRLAQDHRIPYLEDGHHHCHQGWVQTHCPFCGGSSGWHLGVNLESGKCHCWRCGVIPSHQVFRALLPDADIKDLFSRYTAGAPPRSIADVTHAKELTYPPDLGPLHPAHRYYLLKRDFNPESLAEQWGLRGIGPKGGRWAWRIFIPIYNRSGAEVSYTSRAIGSRANPRYLTLENEDSLENPRSLLYGEQKAIDRIIVVEGPSDVWRLGNGAVATMGTSWTAEQATKIARFKWRFILFDNERPAQHAAQKLAAEVAAAPGTTEIVTGLGTDPGDLTSDEVLKLRRELGFGTD